MGIKVGRVIQIIEGFLKWIAHKYTIAQGVTKRGELFPFDLKEVDIPIGNQEWTFFLVNLNMYLALKFKLRAQLEFG